MLVFWDPIGLDAGNLIEKSDFERFQKIKKSELQRREDQKMSSASSSTQKGAFKAKSKKQLEKYWKSKKQAKNSTDFRPRIISDT